MTAAVGIGFHKGHGRADALAAGIFFSPMVKVVFTLVAYSLKQDGWDAVVGQGSRAGYALDVLT